MPPIPTLHLPGGPDTGASEIVGSILMVAITVAVAAGLFSVVYGAISTEDPPLRAAFSGDIQPNDDGWGTGDETVTVSHTGGHAIPISSLAIVVEIGGDETRFASTGGSPLDHDRQDAFTTQDDTLAIGDRWLSSNLTIRTATRVAVTLVDRPAGSVLWSSSFVTDPGDCGEDGQPPSVTNWSQTPEDVTDGTTGAVDVTATVSDNCSVDTEQDPHLRYRVNDGSDPSFTDAGAMNLDSGTTWEGSIPDQDWADHGDEMLEYKLVDMTDDAGNADESSLQQDTIQQTSSTSYVQTPLAMMTGTASNDTDARSASDADAAATLTEASTGTTPSTTEQYGTASSGTANNPENSEGAPDDQYTQFQNNGEAATVSGFPAESGTITQVEIALEGWHDGGQDAGQPDTMRLSHDLGSTEQTYSLSTSEAQRFLDVTSDRAWTWTDIQNLAVTATCECHDTGADNRQFRIDALWVRVTATTETYGLETDAWTFDPLDAGSTHTLEIRYRTDAGEDYQVQTWDGSTWTTQSPLLDQSSFTVFTEELTAAEVSAGPEIRIVDQGSADGSQGSIDVDYVRVVSS